MRRLLPLLSLFAVLGCAGFKSWLSSPDTPAEVKTVGATVEAVTPFPWNGVVAGAVALLTAGLTAYGTSKAHAAGVAAATNVAAASDATAPAAAGTAKTG